MKNPSLGRRRAARAAVLRERTLAERVHKDAFIIDPRGNFVRYWDVIVVLALLFTSFVTPFEVGLLRHDFQTMQALFLINRAVDIVFVSDVVFNFNLMVYDNVENMWISDRWRIVRSYLSGMAVVDIISTIPWEVVSILVEARLPAKSPGFPLSGIYFPFSPSPLALNHVELVPNHTHFDVALLIAPSGSHLVP